MTRGHQPRQQGGEGRPDKLSLLIRQFRRGDTDAVGRLVEELYPELKRLAAAHMNREHVDHTWQPSALVNEFYMELVKVRGLADPPGESRGEKAAFLGFASHLMRRLLINHARRLYRRVGKVNFEEEGGEKLTADDGLESLQRVEMALSRLEAISPRLRTVAELHVFEELTGDEIAERLGCSRRTILRDWAFAKEMIACELA